MNWICGLSIVVTTVKWVPPASQTQSHCVPPRRSVRPSEEPLGGVEGRRGPASGEVARPREWWRGEVARLARRGLVRIKRWLGLACQGVARSGEEQAVARPVGVVKAVTGKQRGCARGSGDTRARDGELMPSKWDELVRLFFENDLVPESLGIFHLGVLNQT